MDRSVPSQRASRRWVTENIAPKAEIMSNIHFSSATAKMQRGRAQELTAFEKSEASNFRISTSSKSTITTCTE